MARLKGAFQADNGDELYPHTSSDVVFGPNGKTVEEQINGLFDKIGSPFGTWLDNADWNTLKTYGNYRVGGVTNSPGGGVWYLEVRPAQDRIIYQRAYAVHGGNIGKHYERVLDGDTGKWTSWEQIATTNKLVGKILNNPLNKIDLRTFIANLGMNEGAFVFQKATHTNITNVPVSDTSYFIKVSGGILFGTSYYARITCASLTMGYEQYECIVYNSSEYTPWTQVGMKDNIGYLRNAEAYESNTAPGDYIDKFVPNGGRSRSSLGLITDHYWANVFGINALNGDVGVTEFAVTASEIFFRNQTGASKMANWDGVKWAQVLTTNKPLIRFTPNPGYTFTNQVSYICGDELYVNFTIARTDGGAFPVGVHSISTCTIPTHGQTPLTAVATDASGQIVDCGNGYLEGWNNNMRIHIKSSNIKYIALLGLARRQY